MPNWCANDLTVIGPSRAVRALLAHVADTDGEEPTSLSLSKIAPMPRELLEVEADSAATLATLLGRSTAPARDWNSWRAGHWGTKWDVTAEVNVGDGPQPGTLEATFAFDSAWSPPTPAVDTLARQYPMCELVLTYDEPGNDFAGTEVWSGGQHMTSEQGPSTSREDWDDEDDDTADEADEQ